MKAIAPRRVAGHGHARLGYAAWSPGQLEHEIRSNGWLTCEGDGEIVFGAPVAERYDRAMSKIGIDPRMLSSEAGHG